MFIPGSTMFNTATPMRFLIFLLCAFGAVTAQAQFGVSVSLPRQTFMALEAIPASVTITNRSGAEAVLGGPGRAAWLSFEMSDNAGRPLAPIEVSAADMVRIPPGGTIQRKVVVTDAYAPNEVGNYSLTARVLHSPTGQHYSSGRRMFNIVDTKPLWEQTFGVPDGFKGAGSARRYSISLFSDVGTSALYFRLIDEQSKLRLQTYRLGPVSMAHDPQLTIDRANQLQVLFLAQPRIYAHCVIGPDGALKKRAYYRETDAGRPQLTQSGEGEVAVVGGQFFDPSAPPPATPSNSGRKVSEKPPGL